MAAARCKNAIATFRQLEEMAHEDIEKYKALEKDAYKDGLSKVVEMGYVIDGLYRKMLDAQETRQDIEDAWRKWDINGLLRLEVIDRNLAKAMHEAPVEQ